MYITSSRSYRQILLTSLKVFGLISILVAPIALLQVISASKAHTTSSDEPATTRYPDDTAHFTSEWSSGQRSAEQLGELFDVNHKQDATKGAGRLILRLKRQTYDEPVVATTGPSLAQLTAAGTAAGIVMGDQLAAAAAEAHQNPDVADEDDESDLYRPDLSALQSHNQQSHNQQQTADSFNPERMPDSMDALMRSEQEDMGADQGDTGNDQGAEQPSASSRVAKDQTNNNNDDDGDDDDDHDDGAGQNEAMVPAAELPRSYLPVQSSEFANSDGLPNYLSGPVYPSAVSGALLVDSPDDLSAAAGHHYKKKKKKKKVKKVIIKKKKKGKKKYKKVKIIKYKKKKKVVKKKKKKKSPKKHHHHHHDHGKYYMYAKVPKKKSWEFGFKKGNKKHWIERHEKGHKNKFKTKVKWFDKKSKGKGLHIWDYNHHDKKKKKHH